MSGGIRVSVVLPPSFHSSSPYTNPLDLCYSKCGLWTSSIPITWALVRKAESQAPSRPTESEPEFRTRSPVDIKVQLETLLGLIILQVPNHPTSDSQVQHVLSPTEQYITTWWHLKSCVLNTNREADIMPFLKILYRLKGYNFIFTSWKSQFWYKYNCINNCLCTHVSKGMMPCVSPCLGNSAPWH